MQRILIIIVCLMLGGTAAYFPLRQQYNDQQAAFEEQYREIRDELLRTQERGRLAEVVGKLGSLLVKAEEHDYVVALDRSTKFFDSLRVAHAEAHDARTKEVLAKVLAQRDEITADLATSNDRVVPKLRALHTNLQSLFE